MTVQQITLPQINANSNSSNTQILFNTMGIVGSNAYFSYNVSAQNTSPQLLIGGLSNTSFGALLPNMTSVQLMTQNGGGYIQVSFANDNINVSNTFAFLFASNSEFRTAAANGSAFTWNQIMTSPAGNQITQARLQANGQFLLGNCPLSNVETRAMTGLSSFLTANTSRTSATGLTNEANLTITINETGTYRLEFTLAFAAGANGGSGYKFDFGGGSATIANMNFATMYSSNVGSVGSVFLPQVTQGTTGVFSFAISNVAHTGGRDQVYGTGVMTVTGVGTLIPRYAQNTSNTDTLVLVANVTHVMLTKIG